MINYGQVKGRKHPANQPLPLPKDVKHGTYKAWKEGCSCPECYRAHIESHRKGQY